MESIAVTLDQGARGTVWKPTKTDMVFFINTKNKKVMAVRL